MQIAYHALGLWVSLSGLVLGIPSAIAQDAYPVKPVRFIAPFPPGGTTDVLSRILAQKLTDSLGRQVLVDNRAGAAGRPRAVNRVPACGMRTSASRDARR